MKTLADFHNEHEGKSAVLFLSGPTLADYKAPETDLVTCGVNTVMFHRQDLDYFFIQDPGKKNHKNSYVNRKDEYDSFKPRIAKFYGNGKGLRKLLAGGGAIPYEYTHAPIIELNGARIEDPNIPARFSSNLASKQMAAAGSIAFPALQFLLWTGVKRIYIVGADITDSRRIGEGKSGQDYVRQNHLGRWKEFEEWVKYEYPNVEIRPLNPVGLRGMFGTRPSFRFHCLAVPHTITSPEFAHCAYTQKVRRFCKFMLDAGHTVYHYGHERSEVECTEHVSVTDDEAIAKYLDWKNTSYNGNLNDECNKIFTRNAIREVKKRFQFRDFVLCWYGCGHQKVAKAFPTSIAVEPGIGTFNSFADFRVFESYSLMHLTYGKYNMSMRNYDAVIPSYLDPTEFIYNDKKEDWLLYLGRVHKMKGIDIAIDIARRTGRKLKVAGQGTLDSVPPHVEMVGYADIPMKADLLSRAAALVQPSLYCEPFGNNVIEAAVSGTPVITPDWGAFTENVVHGVTGWRCRNMDQFDWAVRNIERIDPEACRRWALSNYTIEQAHARYEEYFKQLHGLFFGCDFNGSDPNRKAIVGPTRRFN
jgi:glycosyltransferase involved in cell wall biosynthesis